MNTKRRENEEAFFDKWARTYDAPLFQFWMRKFYKPLLLVISDKDKVLDVSCGSGEFLRELSERTTAELHGLDLSSKMLAVANKKLKGKAHLQKGDVHNLPYPPDTFDYVISTEAFHHYDDQRKALQEMKRVLRKGGKAIIVDVNFGLQPIHWLFEKLEPGCVKMNSKKTMKRLLASAGFRNIQQRRSFVFSILTEGVKS
ncbi:class I SAM-dependent methyltransferase [Candidatus Woesearchaeota archaeon]|nr:class I SAM-dependent methyltransferase [Candidatus Woesearchaeota archaeon]